MSEKEKLQKAVTFAISAGYQLDREAFDLLSAIAPTEDLDMLLTRAIRALDELEEKPFFIERRILEGLLQEEPLTQVSEMPPVQAAVHEPESILTEAKNPFRPLAKEIETELTVIQEPSENGCTDGAVDDFLGYFRDRFVRMEKLLRQRIDVKSAASILDAVRATPNTKLKIIGMVAERRESKQRTILTVEDLEASVTVLIPQNAKEEVKKRASLILADQVICLSVVKTRGTLLIVEDIIFPDIPQRTPHRAADPVYAALTSDLHVGSTKFQREAFNRFVLWLNGKYGDGTAREIAEHVKYVLIAGDIVDGVGIYPNQVKELAIRDIHKQYKLAARFIEQIPDYVEVVIIPGNHDTSRKAMPQPPIADMYLEELTESRKIHSLGNPCAINIHGVDILMDHGRSLDDLLATVPEMDYRHPEKAMQLLLQSRHLAPAYGGKTLLSPQRRDSLVIERIPDLFHAGHVHVLGQINYRGVLIVNSGSWQEQTDYMRRMGVDPTVGKVPVVNLQTFETYIMPFE